MPSLIPNRRRWTNPLIVAADPRLSRRHFLLAGGASALAAYSTAGDLLAGEATSDLAGEDEAVELLRNAAQGMADLDTFRFEIETVSGTSTTLSGLTVQSISGAVSRPYDFTATVVVSIPFGTLSVTAVGVDGSAWIANPLEPGTWIALDDMSEVVALINPDALILAGLGFVQEATIDGSDRIGGVEATRITGVVDFSEAASWLDGTDPMLQSLVSADPIDLLIWLDDDAHVLEIEVIGPILSAESSDVVRSVRFFDFNEPIEIEAPQL